MRASIKRIQSSIKTYEDAVTTSPFIIRFVPKQFLTPELCEIAVTKCCWELKSIILLYPQFITQQLCNIAVAQNGLCLDDVPEKFKTPELCLLAE